MIGIDWGETSFQAFRMTEGRIRDRKTAARGILNIQDGRFGDTLREEIGPWLAAGEHHVLLSGAIGALPGWRAPDLPCPAGPARIAAALADVAFDWAEVRIVPALSCVESGAVETTRQSPLIFGALDRIGGSGLACVPGRRTLWARLEAGRIAGFATHLTGEVFSAWRSAAVPGRMLRDGLPTDLARFDEGVALTARPGGLLNHLAQARSLAAAALVTDAAAASIVWGVLIGYEARTVLASRNSGGMVYVIGHPDLTALHARAIEAAGGMAERLNGEAVANGLALIGAAARWE